MSGCQRRKNRYLDCLQSIVSGKMFYLLCFISNRKTNQLFNIVTLLTEIECFENLVTNLALIKKSLDMHPTDELFV